MAFEYYAYTPSKAIAIIACLIFVAITSLHLWQLFRTRTWFFIPFVLGGLCKSALAKIPYSTMLIPSSRSHWFRGCESILCQKMPLFVL